MRPNCPMASLLSGTISEPFQNPKAQCSWTRVERSEGLSPVFAYYSEARYAVTRWLEPMLAYDGFHTFEGSARTLSVGLNYYPPDISSFEIQTAYQMNYLNTFTQSMEDWHVIAQLVVRF